MDHMSTSYKEVELNWYYIKKIAEIILSCATHELPFHGHDESTESISKRVFLDFVNLLQSEMLCFREN